jgi:hypothetical protein
MTDAVVEMGLRARLVTDTGHGSTADMRLQYRRTAPYEVGVEVLSSGEICCRAIFARELLTYGISQDVGKSTVRIRRGAGVKETRLGMAGGFVRERGTSLAPVVENPLPDRIPGAYLSARSPGDGGNGFR